MVPTNQTNNGGQVTREPIQPAPLETREGDSNIEIHISSLQITEQFLDTLRNATLENSKMDLEDITCLREPERDTFLVDISDKHLVKALRIFLASTNSSREHYEQIRKIAMDIYSDDLFLSFDQIKQCVKWISGVVPLLHDMCINTCHAFTGPYADLDKCPTCLTSCHHPETGKAQRQFTTVPIGPVLQAFYGSSETACHMHYLERKLGDNTTYVKNHNGAIEEYNDTSCSKDLLDAWAAGKFTKDDIALQISIDSAQLYRDKESDLWIFIWIVHNLPPDFHYKKSFVIPGPKKPKEIDLFLFPSLHHVSGLQREGLRLWDASTDSIVLRSKVSIIFATADGPGVASMSGMVGHIGKYGCRLYCEIPG